MLAQQRGKGIRISVNFYNTKNEIDYFLSLL